MANQKKIEYLNFLDKVAKVRYATIKRYGPYVIVISNIRNFRIRRLFPASRNVIDYDYISQNGYVGSFCKHKKCTHPFRQCKDCSFNIQY